MRGPFGNGVVIVPGSGQAIGTTVSWQVNGNTALTAWQVDFYKNDGSGDLIFTSNKQTTNCPFYGIDGNGNVNLFSVFILTGYSFFDIKSGLMVITQWWGDGANDYVVQASPSAYIVRQRPKSILYYNGNPVTTSNPVNSKSATFTGVFVDTDSDSMMWTRWILKDSNNNVIKDTGKRYGPVELSFSYDGFLPGTYTLSLSAETESGVLTGQYSPYGSSFYVSYQQQDPGFSISASRACNGESAVQVTWPKVSSIPLSSSSGSYSMFFKYVLPSLDTRGNIVLSSGASLVWDVYFEPETTVVWRGSAESDGVYFTITFEEEYGYSSQYVEVGYNNGHINLSGVSYVDGHFTYKNSGNISISRIGKMTFAISQSSFICICEAFQDDGLYPSETLYPDSNLYPDSGNSIDGKYIIFSGGFGFGNYAIKEIKLGYSECTVDYVKAVSNHISENTLLSDYVNGTPTTFDAGTLFLLAPNASHSYNAGSFPLIEDYLATNLKLYRRNADNSTLVPVASIPIEKMSVLDFGAQSQQGPYLYYLYVEGDDVFATVPAISNEVNPCFWNWALLSCTKNSDGSYVVQSSYLFGKNLASGAISNNNKPSVLGNFTRYPLVQMSQHNYKSGTLESLIGKIDSSDGQNKYYDTVDLKEEIYALSTTTNYLFLKSRKGDLWMVRPSADITMSTMDNTREQAQTVSFPWVEVGDATDAAIYQIPD